MNKKEYLDKRNALYDKAKKLIEENKLAEAKEILWMIRNRSRQIPLPTNGLTVKNGIFCCQYQRIWQNS